MRLPAILTVLLLSACKPPATDGLAEREERAQPAAGPSEPIASPDTEGAIWSQSATAGRLIYGKPNEPPLFALACETSTAAPVLRLTRFAPADEGAEAFLAVIGNGHVARIPVDATDSDRGPRWEGLADPADQRMEAFSGARAFTATIPGAGMVRFNPSPLPGALIEQCRATAETVATAPEAPAQ